MAVSDAGSFAITPAVFWEGCAYKILENDLGHVW